eukprot:6477304-Amphidinium_carterae.1
MALAAAASSALSACATFSSLSMMASHIATWIAPAIQINPSALIPQVTGWFSSSSSSPSSGNVASAPWHLGDSCGSGFSYNWYYYYVEPIQRSPDVCPGNILGFSMSTVLGLLTASWMVAFGIALCSLHSRSIAGYVYTKARLCIGGLRGCASGIGSDIRDVYLATLFLACEILFVLSRRTPCGKNLLRRAALRLRPYVAVAVQDGVPDETRTPRRSLHDIQMRRGGARRMGKVRLPAIRRKSITILFNPVGKGECLFDAIAYATCVKSRPRSPSSAVRLHLKQHA